MYGAVDAAAVHAGETVVAADTADAESSAARRYAFEGLPKKNGSPSIFLTAYFCGTAI